MEHADSNRAARPQETGSRPLQIEAPLSVPEHEIIRRIGYGSYGQIWLARNMMGTHRAVKIVFRNAFESQRPFERELAGIRKFEPISRLHEGFIDVLQVGINEAQGYFYYIMELGDDQVSGATIDPETYSPRTLASERSHRGKLSLRECLQLGIALSDALAELHKRGLVHRDIKPSNILFVNGIAKMADIGLVAAVQDAPSYVGTEGFIPPEGPGTPQADLYSLGKVLYEISTGKDRHDFPELPTEWSESEEYEGLLELNEVILRSCKPEPAKRYLSAGDMHADLLMVISGKSVKRLRLLEQRFANLKRIAAIAAALLVIAAAIFYLVYREWRVATDARRRQVSANVSYGNRAMEPGDLLAALPYFAEALRLDQGNHDSETTHRLRFGSVLAQCPKLTQMWFASTRVNDGYFSPNGSDVLLAEYYGGAEIHDLQTGRLHERAFGPKYALLSAAYSPDGRFVVTTSESQTAIIWDAITLAEQGRLPHTNAVLRARFSPDGNEIVTSCLDGYARVWDTRTFQLQFALGPHSNGVTFAEFSHDGTLIATASYQGGVRLWYATNGQPTGMTFPHTTWVTYLDFSPDDERLVTACHDHKAHVWDLSTGKRVPAEIRHDDAVVGAEFSPDGRLILTASFDGTARLWRAEDLQPLDSNPILRHGERLTHASFSSDGRRIITTCTDGSVRVWDLAGCALPPVPERCLFSREGNRQLTVSSNHLGIYDAATGKAVGPLINPATSVEKAELTSNGKFVLTTSLLRSDGGQTNRLLQVWNTMTGSTMGPGISLPDFHAGAALSDDGQRMAIFWGGTTQVWSVRSGQSLSALLPHETDVSSVLFNPRGDLLVTTSGTNANVWETGSSRLAYSAFGHPVPVVFVEFSRNGEYLVTCCSDPNLTKCYAQVWNVRTGRPVGGPLRHADGVLSACFSRDGRRVVTTSEDFSAKVWDTSTGRQIGLPLTHRHHVRAGAFSPDARWVATASSDKTARIWDPENTDPLTPPLGHLVKLVDVNFLSDGRHIVTADNKGLRYIWPLPIDDRPVADLTRLAVLLSGGQFIPTADTSGKPPESLSSMWHYLLSKYPGNFSTSKDAVVRWHECQAEECELQEEWFAGAFHLERLLSLRPGNVALKERVAQAKAHLKRGVSAHP